MCLLFVLDLPCAHKDREELSVGEKMMILGVKCRGIIGHNCIDLENFSGLQIFFIYTHTKKEAKVIEPKTLWNHG